MSYVQDFTLQKGERMQKLFRSLIAVGGLVGLAACGDDVSITPPPTPPLTISGAPVTAVSVGARVQLQASEAATWTTSAANVATVDATGLVTAVAAGTASITATATADVNRKASVTITVTAPAVRNVTVSPQAVTMNPGGTQGFVANVDADAGVARTVTWTSSNTAVVTITSAGVATAVAPGAATITATSTANTAVAGVASVNVRTPTQPRVSIQKVTVGGNLNNPVNLLATAGQIDVTIDVDPGDFIAQRVELLVDGVIVGSQNFTAQQSMDLTNSHSMPDVAAAVASTVLSFNTAAFNLVTGEVLAINKNGPHNLSARVFVTGSGSGSTATPSASLAITFANGNTWIANMTETGTTAAATGTSGTAAGLSFKRGGMSFDIRPVIYNVGQSIVAAGSVINFGSFTCDASGTGPRLATLSGTGPFTAVLPQTTAGSVPTVNTVSNYEFDTTNPACTGNFPGGEFPRLTAVDNFGNSILVAALPTVSTQGIRRDNRAPGAPQFAANPNGRQNGWINDAVGLTGPNTTLTDNDWIINGTADFGIGGFSTATGAYQRFLRTADATGGLVDAARAATASDAPTLSPPTATNQTLCSIATARDQLGNESALPAAATPCLTPPVATYAGVGTGTTHLRNGVDIDEPVITVAAASLAAGSPAAPIRMNGGQLGASAAPNVIPACSPNCEFVVTVADIGVIGVSGMLAGTPVRATVVRRELDGTIFVPVGATSDCVVGTLTSTNTVCSLGTLINTGGAGLAVALPLVNTLVSTQTIDGFYTYNGRAIDAAGNFTDLASALVAVHDNTIPALTTALFNVPLTGGTVVFNANASDNLDLWFARYNLSYGGGLVNPILFPDVQINTFNAATLMNSNIAAGITVNGFMRQVQAVTAAPPAILTGNISAQFKPTNLVGIVVDQGNNPSVPSPTAIPGANVTNGVHYTSAAAAQCPGAPLLSVGCLTNTWHITAPAAATNISANNVTACGPVTPATATTVTLTADAFGPTATYNAPFAVVNFFINVAGFLQQIGTGSQQAIFDDGSAQGRRHRWTFDWTPGNAFGCALAGAQLYAIGVNAAGDGLVTMVNTTVTIVP